jgi:DNA polymerase II large subunit
MELKALCMKCRDAKNKPTMQVMNDIKVEEKNNRFSAKGKCAKCGGNMFKFMSKDDALKFKK